MTTKAQRLAADARNRALRSFLAGLGIDVLVAVASVVLVVLSSADAWQGWAAVGISLARSVAQAAASYVLRRFVDPSRIPSPLPPEDPGPPADDVGAGELRLVVTIAFGVVVGALLLYVLAVLF